MAFSVSAEQCCKAEMGERAGGGCRHKCRSVGAPPDPLIKVPRDSHVTNHDPESYPNSTLGSSRKVAVNSTCSVSY